METRPEEERYAKPMLAAILIAASLALGALLIWIVTVDWVLRSIALALLLIRDVLALVFCWLIYKLLGKALYKWARITVAVILGISIAIAVQRLIQSHKLVRYVVYYENESDD